MAKITYTDCQPSDESTIHLNNIDEDVKLPRWADKDVQPTA